ncbi:hypothetical protein ElyMa_000002200 [Elysia marginata]|uniref:Fibrinogen C-terminal domain-containing protein n=1 Tax=Elysia marginata TaxID=1093978 RepID=A0AAV4EAN4_9GAST|nr:hypothetical protein ElyMa_000002200 [Elysia marginata]
MMTHVLWFVVFLCSLLYYQATPDNDCGGSTSTDGNDSAAHDVFQQLFNLIHRLITQAVKDKMKSIENKMDHEISQLHKHFNSKLKALESRCDQTNMSNIKNEEGAEQEIFSGENGNRSLQSNIGVLENAPLLDSCHRGMVYNANRRYQQHRYGVMFNPQINKDILCDIATDGGGWILIQVSLALIWFSSTRSNDFHFDYNLYKNRRILFIAT